MPAFAVDKFKSAVLKSTLLRPNLFRVRLFPPAAIQALGDFANVIADLELMGEASSLPAYTNEASDVKRWGYGTTNKRPHCPHFDPWTVVFRMDGKGQVWKLFRAWNNYIVNVTGDLSGTSPARYEVSYRDQYLADMQVTIFSPTGQDIITATMIEAFPLMIQPIQLDWNPGGDYMRCAVVFSFTDFIEDTIETSPPTGGS